jgi:hypothetical protein
MKFSTTCNNCEPDSEKYITTDVLKDIEIPEETNSSIQTEVRETDSNSSSNSPSSIVSISSVIKKTPTLEYCSTKYFAGYLVNKCLEKYSCAICHTNLTQSNLNLNDEDQILIYFKIYDFLGPTQGLKAPSDLVIKTTKLCLYVFDKYFNKIKSEVQVLKQLKTEVHKEIIKAKFIQFYSIIVYRT